MKLTAILLAIFFNLHLTNGNNYLKCSSNNTKLVTEYNEFVASMILVEPSSTIALKQSSKISKFSKGLSDCYWCYPSYPCLQVGGPYITQSNPISMAPIEPDIMNVKFELHTRRNRILAKVFKDPHDVSDIFNSHFQNNSQTIFYVGGYFAGIGMELLTYLAPAFFKLGDFNVFNVNWLWGSIGVYQQAIGNSRLVGLQLGIFIQNIQKLTGHPLGNVYLVCSSLGAHLCGYAGQYLKGNLKRITGLDPAGPYFEGSDPIFRLDPSDAQFVDVIHTFAGSLLPTLKFGIKQRCGHLDFYPNGGSIQPGGCVFPSLYFITNIIGVLTKPIPFCDHSRSLFLYYDTITNVINNSSCKFTSYPCPNYDMFKANQCNNCGTNGTNCPEMGVNAINYIRFNTIPASNAFYLDTTDTTPFCKA